MKNFLENCKGSSTLKAVTGNVINTFHCVFIPLLTHQISVYQEHNLDWFPRMRAMSLVSSDADGEQNEIRNLQEKLESTMKLVSNLSGQLTELKEQVGLS